MKSLLFRKDDFLNFIAKDTYIESKLLIYLNPKYSIILSSIQNKKSFIFMCLRI